MRECIQQVEREFGVSIPHEFRPCSIYNTQLDYLEYIAVDQVTVHDRIDEYLTLVLDSNAQEVVGFRLKGFQYVYNRFVKPLLSGEPGFENIISVLTAITTTLGDKLYLTEQQKKAYRQAADMVRKNKIGLPMGFAA